MNNKEFIESITLEGEIWCDVIGYEGLYMVSSFGRIASLSRIIHCTNRDIMSKNKILIPFTVAQHGYYAITLVINGNKKKFYIHKLVAKHFIPNPNNLCEIDHIDGNPLNNNVNNLRWCTHSENMNNPITKKRASDSLIGTYNNATSKSVVQLKNGLLINIYKSMADAQRNGFLQSEISRACSGKCKTHKGFEWMYLTDYETLTNMSKNALSNTNT